MKILMAALLATVLTGKMEAQTKAKAKTKTSKVVNKTTEPEPSRNFKVTETQEARFIGTDEALVAHFMKGLVFDSAAVRANAEGVLVISFTVNSDSTVTKPSIIQPFGFGVDEQALELVTQLKFSPARVNGIPIRSTHMIEIPVRAYFK